MFAAKYSENTEDIKAVKLAKVAKPETIPANHALVKIQAAAINPVDTLVMRGVLKGIGWDMPLPFTMGYDFSGTIEALGDRSKTDLKVGDEVFGVNWGTGNHNTEPAPGGAFAEYILVQTSKLSRKAPVVSHEEAAAVALVGTTCYQALDKVGVHDGDVKKILILGGSSAVGALAIQMAKKAGCWVATTCSGRTKEYVKSFGAADLIIDYMKEKWEDVEAVQGVDVVFDAVGEKEALERSKKILGNGSFITIVSHQIGFDPSAHPPLKFASSFVLSNDAKVQDKLMSMLESKDIKIVIDKKFPFTNVGLQDALAAIETGKSTGKNVITM